MLLREPPKSLEVSGKVYKIRTDFRIWLGLQALFQETVLTAEEKALIACRCVYGRKNPREHERGAGRASVVLRGWAGHA